MLHFPAAASAVKGPGHDQTQDRGLAAGPVLPGDEHQGAHRLTAAQGGGQTPGHRQQQGALQEGVQGQEGRIVQVWQVPALQPLNDAGSLGGVRVEPHGWGVGPDGR